MHQQTCTVLWNKKVAPAYYRIGLGDLDGYHRSRPGQFIMLRVAESMDPLLRRPFSIHRLIKEKGRIHGIELLYKVVGQGTHHLSRIHTGKRIDILGPLGNGFRLPDRLDLAYIAGGGIGVAPLVFLSEFLLQEGVPPEKIGVFQGGRGKEDLLCREHFESLGLAVTVTTDDGSEGNQCFITDPLELAVQENMPDIIWACGPPDMLSCVAGIAEKYHIACQLSLEAMMACGLGACLGCAVPERGKNQYLHVCKDGPVIAADRIDY
jgi:dihydroorotate dehydrogenase electron transfer subunit